MSIPKYDMGSTFDNIKIIFNSLIGDPRYQFKPNDDKSCMVAYNKFDDHVFEVHPYCEAKEEEKIYAEQAISLDSINNYKEYGKLFYTYGENIFKLLAGLFVRRDCYGKGIITVDTRSITEKLGIAFGNNFRKFQTLIGIRDRDDSSFHILDESVKHIDPSDLISSLDYIIDTLVENKSGTVEFGEILSIFYCALSIYLSGVVINYAEKLGISYETLYGDGNSYAIEQFGDRLIGSTIDNDIKYKLISLFYTYYIMTNFYEKHLGFSITDRFNDPFVKIGEKVSKLDKEYLENELDISYLTQSDLTRKSNITMMSIFCSPSVITEPTIFDSYLPDNDIVDGCTIAHELIKFTSYNDIDDIKKISVGFDAYLDDKDVDQSKVDVMYNHFIDNVANTIPHTLSPKYFFKIAVYAAAFKKLKETKAGKIKEIAALGSYQAEAIMTFLLKLWFKPTLSFMVSKGVYCNDIRATAKEYKAKAYILMTLNNYSDFISSLTSNEISQNNYPLMDFIYNVIDPINVCKDDLTSCKEYIDNYTLNYEYNKYPAINESNFEKFDSIVEELNKGNITLPVFYYLCRRNSEGYRIKYINDILETDYNQNTLDKLADYAEDDEEAYQMIDTSKLSRALCNNIKKILFEEKLTGDLRFEVFFNVFIKYIIPLQLVKNVYDRSTVNEDDKLSLTNYEIESQLPNLKSTRLFNFIKK